MCLYKGYRSNGESLTFFFILLASQCRWKEEDGKKGFMRGAIGVEYLGRSDDRRSPEANCTSAMQGTIN
jgi:hypothetical protein